MTKKKSEPKNVDAIRHNDKRKNIPTEELRDFVTDDEMTPKATLYSRDTSLDPQLVWKGKDEQDLESLSVPIVPIYIQEKIHPQAIINSLPRIEQPNEEQFSLFADFNGGPKDFEKKIDFYTHEQNWSNRLILGDSLLVMNSLAEKEGLKGKVQAIYLDPPYGIKFGSNWQVSTRKRDVKEKPEDATRQPEQVRAFRDTWKLGIHSYLAYLRDRLVLARELLTETGSVFVQIGDENVHLVRSLLDEVFGSENFVSQIAVTKTAGGLESTGRVPARLDYILWYARQYDVLKYRPLFEARVDDIEAGFTQIELIDGDARPLTKEERLGLKKLPEGARLYRSDSLTKPGPGSKYEINLDGKIYNSGNRWWGSPKESILRLIRIGRVKPFGNTLRYMKYLDDFPFKPLSNLWDGIAGAKDPVYVVQTNEIIIQRCILMSTDPGDLVLDPTCGSGTTAFVAEQWGRRWITCDTSRVALALTRTRLMASIFKYYLLVDSPEGIEKESELTGKTAAKYETGCDIKRGFIYKRVPHVTLTSIANNPDIKDDMTRDDVNSAIARHADIELLYDKPYEDSKRTRVCGPFTVESLSPHRVLSIADSNQDSSVSENEAHHQQDFATMIMENLKKAGVQNTHKNERLKFDRLDPYAGTWLHAAGEYTDIESKVHRVAVSIGPEHGTVGPQQVKEAAKEAVQGVGFDLLIVCGFAFDPHVNEEVKRYGKLTVLPTKMNPDLAMSDELLKKTGAGNLFMVFGEPDVDIQRQKDGQIVVEIKGVDVYDPTTGQIRNSSTDDIACWFIDTDYNGESFFVRHAYFTGADEPYDKLKRALRSDIDEAVWSTLYSTVSRPFAKPETGKIAIKVINHYGDEVLKVITV